MKPIIIFFTMMIFVIIACERKPLSSSEKSEGYSIPKVIVEKEKGEREQPLPSEVKIKVKRDDKNCYSWELSGSDVDQILKVNEKLRKQLGGEPRR
jgi:hypothetical protein